MRNKSAIVKIGGIPARDSKALKSLASDIGALAGPQSGDPVQIAVVHGGGADVTALSERLGIQARFSDGIRMTTEAEMDVVDMVLCGLVNKRLVRAFGASGVAAIGISGADGGLFVGKPIPDTDGNPSRTAKVDTINTGIVEVLWASGYVPVIASPGVDNDGGAVNINADEAALAVGIALRAGAIVFLSDVTGVKGANAEVLESLGLSEAERLIAEGIITGGMVAKLRSAAGAIAAGVHHVVIGSYESSGDLDRLLSGHRGTTIYGDQQ